LVVNAEAGLSRRQLLGVSGAAGAAALAAGCGVLPAKVSTLQKIALTVDRPDVPILEGLLRLEYTLAYAYTASIPRLNGYGLDAARWFLRQELGHIGAVSTLLKSGGVKPNTAAGSPHLGQPGNESEVVMLLHRLETQAIRAYLEAVAKLSNGQLRAVASAILATEAQHVSILRRAQGLEPVPSALLTGYE
jgi:Ferritin-like domain